MRASWIVLGLFVGLGCGRAPTAPRPDAGPTDAAHADAWPTPAPRSAEPPPIPLGLDAYRDWARWAQLRLGVRAYMRSTYDRAGANEGGDASHFLRQDADDRNVTLDVGGPGVLYFVRTNHWHGSPWHYTVDGRDTVVRESSTATPDAPVANSVFMPTAAFPHPLTWTWSDTQGADLSWVPIAFEHSFVLAYGRTHYGTGYYIFHQFASEPPALTSPLHGWRAEPPDPRALDVLLHAGDDTLLPGDLAHHRGTLDLRVGVPRTVVDLAARAGLVRMLRFSVAIRDADALADARVRIHWDGRPLPSVDAPLGLLFGTGSVYNREGREYLVRSVPATVRFADGRAEFSLYFPMPFFTGARVELESTGRAIAGVRFDMGIAPYTDPVNWSGYFHATYRDHPVPVPGRDLVLLDTAHDEGGGAWCGSFVGTSFVFSDRAALGTLEGDPRFFFDDSASPQAYGTGTEEWGGGGDYWGGRTMTLPLAGHPVGAPNPGDVRAPADAIESAYRFLLADLMPFGRRARIQLEHGGENDSDEHYRTVTYWYGLPRPCLVQTDALDVGDLADESRHRYVSPDASPIEMLQSREELGVDHLAGVEIYPERTETGRHTTGRSEFTVALQPDNRGVLLRRTLDYGFADQRAEVYVADDRADAIFVHAGTWYLAGSNQCVYSNPGAELGAAEPVVQTSNRRLRDDEFLLPRRLTAGRRAVRVRVVFAPTGARLTPSVPAPPSAWSELRYTVYSYVMP